MLLALTSGQKLGLAAVAVVFIAFALASSFLFPRRNPDFPGRGLRLFLLVTVLLFAAMMSAVFVFAREAEEEAGHGAEPAAETQTGPTETGGAIGSDDAGPSETQGETDTQPGTGEGGGDAAAGEEVFASAGCGGCHVLSAAGASGTVGPSLDESKPGEALVVERVTNGRGAMPSFRDRLSEQQIRDVAAYVAESAGG